MSAVDTRGVAASESDTRHLASGCALSAAYSGANLRLGSQSFNGRARLKSLNRRQPRTATAHSSGAHWSAVVQSRPTLLEPSPAKVSNEPAYRAASLQDYAACAATSV